MKKTMLAVTGAVIILAGCQDEKPAETSAVETPQVFETEVSADALPLEEEQLMTAETFVDSAHNAKNALDWDGTYKGTLPCADCTGIDITLTLNQDGTYVLEQNYQDKQDVEFKSEGNFAWDENGSIVTLTNEEAPNQYFVGENILMKLDLNGDKVTGELASSYTLTKQ